MNKRILVIDDEPAVRLAFELALDEAGYDVVTAGSGEEGLARAREDQPALVYLDLRMPGIDGVETLRRLRSEQIRVPVYIVTAFRKEFFEDLGRASVEGLDFQVVDKPITIEQIVAITRGALEGAAPV